MPTIVESERSEFSSTPWPVLTVTFPQDNLSNPQHSIRYSGQIWRGRIADDPRRSVILPLASIRKGVKTINGDEGDERVEPHVSVYSLQDDDVRIY